jgi:hypothetical protein
MSSIKAENPYRFMNRLAGLAFYLKEDNKSVVGHYVDDVNREKWVKESLDNGGVYIRSEENGLRIGFSGEPAEGAKIIVGDSTISKVWDLELAPDAPDYKVRLRGTHWVIEFDRNNIHPGMQARLAKEKFPEDISQVWVVNKLN